MHMKRNVRFDSLIPWLPYLGSSQVDQIDFVFESLSHPNSYEGQPPAFWCITGLGNPGWLRKGCLIWKMQKHPIIILPHSSEHWQPRWEKWCFYSEILKKKEKKVQVTSCSSRPLWCFLFTSESFWTFLMVSLRKPVLWYCVLLVLRVLLGKCLWASG